MRAVAPKVQLVVSIFDVLCHTRFFILCYDLRLGFCTALSYFGFILLHGYALLNFAIVADIYQFHTKNPKFDAQQKWRWLVRYVFVANIFSVASLFYDPVSLDADECNFMEQVCNERKGLFFLLQVALLPILIACLLIPTLFLGRDTTTIPPFLRPLMAPPEQDYRIEDCAPTKQIALYPLAFFICHIGTLTYTLIKLFGLESNFIYAWFQFGISILGSLNCLILFLPHSLFTDPVPIPEPIPEPEVPKPAVPIPIPTGKHTKKYPRKPQTIEPDFKCGSSDTFSFPMSDVP
ncbi:hypothetical protein L0F63_002723 [Massospora cicadina]|nr:hypothetical protein L0F63_002723 [Massospora cicadina]